MAGNCGIAHAEGRLSLERERRRVRVTFKSPVSPPNPSPASSPVVQEERRKITEHMLTSEGPISCGWPVPNPFKLCDFLLVTPARLLY
jgi:hypothetical protein